MRKGFRITRIAKITAVLAAIVFSGFIGFRIYAINKAYPAAKVKSYSMGDKFDFHGAEISVDGAELCHTSDIIEGYVCDQLDNQNNPLSNDECKVLIVTITAENKTDEELMLPFHEVNAESVGWHNGLGLTEFCAVNEGITWPDIKLPAGETTTVKLTFNMFSIQFKDKEWERVDDREYDLLFSEYPVKTVVEVVEGELR